MAQISLRVDDDVKRGAEQALSDIGLSMSTAINVFLRKVAREHRIPFELSADVPNAETVEAIQEVKRMKADPGLGKTYTDVDVLLDYDRRAAEVARLMGSVGQHAIVNAKELLDWSDKYKKTL